MKKYTIAVLPLDGVGKDVIPLGAQAMEKAREKVGGFRLDMRTYDAGVEYAVNTGEMMEDGLAEGLVEADAMLAGSGGHYDLEMAKSSYPGFKIGSPIVQYLRSGIGNNIGLRPLRLLKGLTCPLRTVDAIDVYLVRELGEGFYINPGHQIGDNAAYDTLVVTRKVTEEFAEAAFSIARGRNGRLQDGKKMVTLGNKHGCIACFDFYRKVFSEVALKYPDVELHFAQVDALAEHLLKDPARFDVIACENMIGDIIGDIGAYITGGMGVTPTADIGGVCPQFRPNHGTFPRAVGKNFANPFAAIHTASMLLDTIGMQQNDPALRSAADLILAALEYNFMNDGPRTRDMGGSANTMEAAQAVFDAMDKVSL